VSALSDLLAARTSLDEAEIGHVQRLVGEWQLLADLAFSDLLLWLPVDSGDGADVTFLCMAQCRPTTGPTAYLNDQVGGLLFGSRAEPLRIALQEGRIFREGDPYWDGDLPIRREAIPVRVAGAVVAVIGRDSNLASVRSPSQLELVYLQSAADLAAMVAEGTFPGSEAEAEDSGGPRVGDGVMRVGLDGTIAYASPNALSAFRRLGVTGNVLGETFDSLQIASDSDGETFDAETLGAGLHAVISHGRSRVLELDGGGASVAFRALPLRPRGEPLGALVLVQDVTEVRRRDRALLSKDATIREIHHRVKNNLQTVAALLRLQARRVTVPEARTALEESMRRVTSIALVHETLSESIDEDVAFDDIVDRLLEMLSDVMGATDRVLLERRGTFGEIPAEAATPLVLVLTELVQNAVEHAFAPAVGGRVVVSAERGARLLTVTVTDDGHGLPPGFAAEASDRLGLQIVRTLVGAELGGTLRLQTRSDGRSGTRAVVTMQLARRAAQPVG
jgi:two-component system, sensor histidine kinase PdtaS